MTTFSFSHIKGIASRVGGEAQWTPESIEALDKIAVEATENAAALASKTVLSQSRKRVSAEDVIGRGGEESAGEEGKRAPLHESESGTYVGWLEDANEAFAREIKKLGGTVPKLPPAPIERTE